MELRYDRLYKSLCGMGAALVCFLLLLPTLQLITGNAQTDINSERTLDAKIQTFFGSLMGGNSSEAFGELLRSSPLGSADARPQLTELQKKVEEAKQFGEIINWEEYESKRIGKDIMSLRYILKYEQYPIIWTFTFYRKPSGPSSMTTSNPWVLIDLRLETDFL